MDRKEVTVEPLLEELDGTDGLGASLIRLGPGMSHTGPDPRATGGQYYLVLNGGLRIDAGGYAAWSTVFVSRNDGPLAFRADSKGLEALLLQFPRQEP
jgi:hypothetical protein